MVVQGQLVEPAICFSVLSDIPGFSTDVFQTLQTCIEDIHGGGGGGGLMELELNLTELQPFKLGHFLQLFCSLGYGVCVINISYSFQ